MEHSHTPAADTRLRSRRPRRPRTIALALGLAGAVAVALALLASGIGGGGATARPATVSVTVLTAHPGKAVPRAYLGLSFEATALPQIASFGERGNLVALLRSLGPGLLRFGGVTADTRIAWSDAATPAPAWTSRVIRASDMRALRRLAERSGWGVLLTVGLVHYEPRAAAREVAAAARALGPWLVAVEVGNEPDAYGSHKVRPASWSYAAYDAEVRSYRHAIAALTPRVALAGPGVSGSHVYTEWGPLEASSERPLLLTGHHYPLGCRQVPPPSIARLLSGEIRRLEGTSLSRYMAVTRTSGIPFRMDEANSVSCGGRAGISNAFAAALWASSYITRTMAAGVAGINFQANPVNCLGYTPICASDPQRLAAGVLSAQPLWYALLLTRGLVGDTPLHTTVSAPRHPNVTVSALRSPTGALHLVIVDGDPPGSPAAALRVRVGARYDAASVLLLSAPAPDATTGVRLGGAAVPLAGSWRTPPGSRLPVAGGVLSLTIAPSSAALVTVSPGR